jgi:hypothetical protein
VIWRIYISWYFLDYCIGWNLKRNVRREDLKDISQENSVSWKCVVILFFICIVMAVIIILGNCVWFYKCGKNSVITDSCLDGTVPSGRLIPSVTTGPLNCLWICLGSCINCRRPRPRHDVLLWAECGRRQLLPAVSYWRDICVNDWSKLWKTLEIVSRLRFERDLPSNETELLTNEQGRSVPLSGNMDLLVFVENT